MECRERELSILITDDRGIRPLNRQWLGRDRATNVLAFPQAAGGPEPVLGDVVISVETCLRRARRRGVPAEDELRRVLVHGILHLMGYDHVVSARGRAAMLVREDEMLALVARRAHGPIVEPSGATRDSPPRVPRRSRPRGPRRPLSR